MCIFCTLLITRAMQIENGVQRFPLNLKSDNLTALINQLNCFDQQFFSVEVCSNRTINKTSLKKLSPKFCSVPWHHNPEFSNQNVLSHPSIAVTETLIEDGYTVLQHLPCGFLTKTQAVKILNRLVELHVRYILVIRGDLRPDENCEFKYAVDFVRFVRQFYKDFFCIGVAGYVDCHPLSPSENQDLKFLKEKVDAGGDFIITQMVFDFDAYHSFCLKCKKIGIDVPIIPGLYIIHSWKELFTVTEFCKVNVPKEVTTALLENIENPKAILNYGLDLCINFMQKMVAQDGLFISHVHFFCLNNFEHLYQLLEKNA